MHSKKKSARDYDWNDQQHLYKHLIIEYPSQNMLKILTV